MASQDKGKATQTREEYEEQLRRVAESPNASASTEVVKPVMTLDQALQNVQASPPTETSEQQQPSNTKIYEYTEQDRLAEEFMNKPIAGPLISQIKMTSHIANDYATADPNFVVKTKRLAVTHPYWRSSKGDGNCGWRAIMYGYLELLLRLNSADKVTTEVARLQSMKQWYAGNPIEDTLDDFGEGLFVILESITEWIKNGAEKPSMEEFMDKMFDGSDSEAEEAVRDSTYYLRVLAALWLKQHREDYEVFIEGNFDEYVIVMQQATTEIDQIGLKAMHSVVLEQAGFGLEVLDLNRSEGVAVNESRFEPHTAGVETHPEAWVRLLYRPGHYDIIYKDMPGILA